MMTISDRVTIERLRVALGTKDVAMVRERLGRIVGFFRDHLHADPLDWTDYLFGIDLYRDVQVQTLPKGKTLIRYESVGAAGRPKPFLYFTEPGTSEMQLGTNFERVQFQRFHLDRAVVALVSRASSISFRPSRSATGRFRFDRRPRPGGGLQYIVPRAMAPTQLRLL